MLLTEVVQYVDESGYGLKYPKVDWFHVTCYPYAATRWRLNTCAQELDEHPEWDLAILDDPHTQGAVPEPWVAMAESKGRGWLIWREE